ncbi:MAG TPA: phenylalanine--tRNA ligase beta subunit-related protein [Streptosporangiaceae bacterium]|jgi:DNA/RNA-binding domain of Phe-tRNA-synthetase-like protein
MLAEISIDDAVWALRPDFAVLVITVRGMAGGPSDDASRELLADAAKNAPHPADHPHVAAWREAYRAFGAKPKRTRPSVDALLRRAPGGLPEINRVVDAYNAISVRHALPVGGEDLAAYSGPARLVRATGEEPFDTMAEGEPAVDHPAPGEVVWRDDAGVTCRRWNWRQCARTQITEATRDGLFILERLEPMTREQLQVAGGELVTLLTSDAPAAEVETRLITPPDAG